MSKKETLALICNKCNHVLHNAASITIGGRIKNIDIQQDVGASGICPHCNKHSYFFAVDDGIAEILSLLNRSTKYETIFSCQGHAKCTLDNPHDYSIPYVYIKLKHPQTQRFTRSFVNMFKKSGWTDISCQKSNKLLGGECLDLLTVDGDTLDKALKISDGISFYLSADEIYDYVEELIHPNYTPSYVTMENVRCKLECNFEYYRNCLLTNLKKAKKIW